MSEIMFDRKRLLQLMNTHELDALVVSLVENVTYLTAYSDPLVKYFPDLEEYAVVVGDKPRITLVIPAVNGGFAIGRDHTADEILLYGRFAVSLGPQPFETEHERAYADLMRKTGSYSSGLEAVESVLCEAGVAQGRIGIDRSGYSFSAYTTLERRVGDGSLVDVDGALRTLRAVKTPKEIERLRAAARVNEAAYEAMREAVRPGVSVAEIQKVYRSKIAEQGGELAFSSTGGGPMGGGPWLDTRLMTLREGDTIRFDGVLRFDGFWSDFGRTLAVGFVTPEVAHRYGAIRSGYDSALRLIRHGARASDIYAAALSGVRAAGLSQFDRHHVGHGIGLHPYDYPVISPNPNSMYAVEEGDAVLQTNMVLCIEVPFYELGTGGCQLEDTIVVTESGYEYITVLDRDIHVC